MAAMVQTASSTCERDQTESKVKLVPQFREILLWPLQLMTLKEGPQQIHHHWELLARSGEGHWEELLDEFVVDPNQFQERHYREFVTLLPHVQRFLYGEESKGGRAEYRESPLRVYRRKDVSEVRIHLHKQLEPVALRVEHVDLHFFYDVDVVILTVEVHAADLPLQLAQEIMFLFGRAYPSGWSEDGTSFHCARLVEWLAADGRVLATSDFEKREKFLASVRRHRAAAIAAHWEYLLEPMVPHHSARSGELRYRQLDDYRMPIMAFLALEDPEALTRADYVRLAFGTASGQDDALPFSSCFLQRFETEYCYDRYFERGARRQDWCDTRIMCSGHAFVMVGDEHSPFFTDPERGLLGQFRQQYFLLGLLAHFHRAALLMLSDRLVSAVKRLDIAEDASIRRFRRDIRQTLEIFLRFTHRYWYHEVSDQGQLRDLFHMWTRHLRSERLYKEVRDELHDMSTYLDSDMLRRQSNTMVRLTVVTIFGLIGMTVTGFFGMNLLAWAGEPLVNRVLFFLAVLIPTVALTVYTLVKSRRLADFMDTLSDERLARGKKLAEFRRMWSSSRS
jgi:hypothetical protein